MTQSSWLPDPNDPRAPSQDEWDRMTPEERKRVVAALPSEVPLELHPPEGDPHRIPKDRTRDALGEFFRTIGRRVYVTSELGTYYPGEPRFCPDILAVLDVDPRERSSWVVSDEGKGLDLVVEVHVDGDKNKDFKLNVERYARLGIPEYFIFDRRAHRLLGYRLKPNSGSYERILPQAGRFTSNVLGLDLTVEGGLLRFYYGTAPVLFLDEVVSKLNAMVAELVEARDQALQRAEEQAQRAEEQAQRAELAEKKAARATELEREVATLRAEIEKLRQKL